ncbi:MAG: bacterial Ig-like domain-containing protein, partial [Clostridia bacterium]|nr:bacterial Ig-like domain-containing protein [Clostridia bacterium]
MRGKNYNDGSRRLVGGSALGVIAVVLTIAVALIFVLLLYLPLTDETNKAGIFGKGQEETWNKIVSIAYPEKEIGVGSEKDKIYLRVTYDNGETEDVPLSQMICSGLDVTTSGTQTVSLSYGGFEQVIPITVKDVNCVLNYSASDGGRIQGECHQSIVSGHDGSTVIAVPETGYTFKEWNDGYPYPTRKDKNVNETRDYHAIFEKTQFVVFFFYDDGTVAREDTVLYGEAATDIPKMSDPRMSVYGKTFQGWSVNESDYQCVVRNMNIYPQYVKTATDVNVTVESDQYGSHMGTTDVNEFGYYEHDSIASIIATPYNSREFDCWKVWGYTSPSAATPEWIEVPKKSATGEIKVVVYIGDNREQCTFTSNSVSNSGSEYMLTFVPNAYMDVIDIRAQFVYNNSTVTFINYQNSVKNNQECVIADIPYGKTLGEALAEKVTTEDGANLTLDSVGMLMPASVYGYTFLGWYDKLDETQSLVTVNKIFREPTSLVAKWEKLVYTVVFDYSTADNSDLTYEIEVVFQNTVGSGGGVPTALPYREKYNFIGWEDVLTHDLVDDTTQITVKEEYLSSNKNFVDERKIYFAPRWEAKEHVLRVQSSGSGTVYVRIHPLVGPTEETVIAGEQIIFETYSYELVFRADVGYYVSSYIWQFENDVPIKQTNVSEAVSPIPKSDGNNFFTVTFSPIVYTATIFNGDAVYRGYVEGVAGSDADTVSFDVHYGDTVSLNILSPNEAYEISDIRVSGRIGGVLYDNESIERGLAGSHTLRYNLLLENCTSNLTVTILYDSVSFSVNVKAPDNATIGTTVFNGTAGDYEVAPEQRSYAPNERVFYVIEAQEGYYISDVRINGAHYDIYGSVSDSVVFYDWEVNKASYGVGLRFIGGVYYYCYGSVEYDGATYMYCRNVADGSGKIFIVLDALNERYEAVDASGAMNAAVPNEYFEDLSSYLISVLAVDKKGIGNSAVEKDRRVTKVKMMLLPSSNVNIAVTAESVYYTFSVAESSVASSNISSVEVVPGDKVTVKTKPITGYTVAGYYLNGSEEMTPVSMSSSTQTFVKEFLNIDQDYSLVFAYELITYTATFTALTNGSASIREQDSADSYVLARSHTFEDLKFASQIAYVITAAAGKKISSLTVDGTPYPVVENMTSYLFVWQSVRSSLTVTIGCDDLVETGPVSGGYELVCNTSADSHVATSVKYGSDVYLTVLAEEGYYLHSITVHGKLSADG